MSQPNWMACCAGALILFGAAWILQPFSSAMLWSAIMAMTTWPLYQRIQQRLGSKSGSAFLAVTGFFIIILIPSLWLTYILSIQTTDVINALVTLHHQGYPEPLWLKQVPLLGDNLSELWHELVKGASIPLFSSEALGQAQSMGRVMTQIGRQIATPVLTLFLTLFLLFFWYRDGDAWLEQYQRALKKYHLEAWQGPIAQLTQTLRSTVNGTILTSLGMGLLLGLAYGFVGIPTAALLGLLSGFLSVIPFALPILLLGLWIYLAITATWLVGLNLFLGGFVLMLICDNVVKPHLIQGHTMPFWMVLLGILGGVHALGLLGLFLGPMILASLMLVWQRMHQH